MTAVVSQLSVPSISTPAVEGGGSCNLGTNLNKLPSGDASRSARHVRPCAQAAEADVGVTGLPGGLTPSETTVDGSDILHSSAARRASRSSTPLRAPVPKPLTGLESRSLAELLAVRLEELTVRRIKLFMESVALSTPGASPAPRRR